MANTTYIIKEGDTLTSIAKAHNSTVDAIAKANNIQNTNLIHVGATLQIPNTQPMPSPATRTTTTNSPSSDPTISSTSENNKLDSINETFSQNPVSSKQGCAAKKSIYIFPVRYAIDESPDKKNIPGLHTIPSSWGETGLPAIKTRNYCMRQLRDGWLYVWDGDKFDEYQVKGLEFTHTNRQNKTIPPMLSIQVEPTAGEKGTKKYLTYDTSQTLRMAYAQERWTERLYAKMQKNEQAHRNQWMRSLDLTQHCQAIQPHTQLLEKIVPHVADVYQTVIMPGDGFKSTTVHYQEPTEAELIEQVEIKPPVLGSQIIGEVPDKESAIFVALDDHIGVLNDLTLQLAGRNQELTIFDKEHLHKLQTAKMVKTLCGVPINQKEYPTNVVTDTQRQQFQQELEDLCREVDTLKIALHSAGDGSGFSNDNNARSVWNETTAGMTTMVISKKSRAFRADYPTLTENWFVQKYQQWRNNEKSRRQVKYQEAIDYLVKEEQRKRIQQHIEEQAEDLKNYLVFIGNNPNKLYLDPTNQQHQALLTINLTCVLETITGYSEKGQAWYAESLQTKNNLLALISYHFSAEFAEGFENMISYYQEHQEIEQGQGSFDIASLISKMVAGGNIANATEDSIGALGELYKRFTTPSITSLAPTESSTLPINVSISAKELIQERLRTAITKERFVNSPFYTRLSQEAQQIFIAAQEVIGNLELPNKSWQNNVFITNIHLSKFYRNKDSILVVSLQVMHSITVEGTRSEFIPICYTDTRYEETLKAVEQRIKTINAQLRRLMNEHRGISEMYAQQRRHLGKKLRIRFVRLGYLIAALQAEKHELITNPPQKNRITGYLVRAVPNIVKEELVMKLRFIFMQGFDLTDYVLEQWLGKQGLLEYKRIRKVQSLLPVHERLPVPVHQSVTTTAAEIESSIKWSPGILGSILIILNFANCFFSINKMASKDLITLDDIATVVTSHAYFGSLLFSFKVTDLWKAVGNENVLVSVILDGKKVTDTQKLMNLAPKAWPEMLDKTVRANALEFRLVAKGMAILNFIGSGIETIQIWSNISNSTTTGETIARSVKGLSTLAMTVISGIQLSAFFGIVTMTFAFGPWMIVAGIVAAIVYFISSLIEEYFHIEGFDKWLNACAWGYAPIWPDNELGHKQDMRALQELLLKPSLYALPILDERNKLIGRRLQIVLPSVLLNKSCIMKTLLISNKVGYQTDRTGRYLTGVVGGTIDPQSYQQLAEGYTIDFATFKKNILAAQPNNLQPNNNNVDEELNNYEQPLVWEIIYEESEQYFSQFDILELTLNYPKNILSPRVDNKGYRFKLNTFGRIGIINATLEENELDANQPTKSTLDIDIVSHQSQQITLLPPITEE